MMQDANFQGFPSVSNVDGKLEYLFKCYPLISAIFDSKMAALTHFTDQTFSVYAVNGQMHFQLSVQCSTSW